MINRRELAFNIAEHWRQQIQPEAKIELRTNRIELTFECGAVLIYTFAGENDGGYWLEIPEERLLEPEPEAIARRGGMLIQVSNLVTVLRTSLG